MTEKNKSVYSLTVYLLKSSCTSFDDAVDKGRLVDFRVAASTNDNLNNTSRIYIRNSFNTKPEWAKFLQVDVSNSSASSLYLGLIDNRIMAITFGPSGRFLLKESMIVRRFGLMVVLNSVEPESLHSIDKVMLSEDGLQSRIQASRPSGSSVFGIDIQRDLVRNVSGRSKNKEVFGSTVVGKDSLSVRVRADMQSIGGFLRECLRAYESKEYKKKFAFIDNIKPCDSQESLDLDIKLATRLNRQDSGSLKKWLSVPEIIDWKDHSGFRYSTDKNKKLHDDLSFEDFIETIPDESIDVEVLKSSRVVRVHSDDGRQIGGWSLYRCLYAELSVDDEADGSTFILTDGSWYRLEKDFVGNIKARYSAISKLSDVRFPKYNSTGKESEEDYNKRLAIENNGQCFDRKIVQVEGRSGFEFCDVFCGDGKIVHVKRYASSSALSHLFNQGLVSASLIRDPNIRSRVQNDLGGVRFEGDFMTSKYEIVYGIISKSDNELEIPFFSKVTLVNIAEDLNLMGYRVSLIKVSHEKGEDDAGNANS